MTGVVGGEATVGNVGSIPASGIGCRTDGVVDVGTDVCWCCSINVPFCMASL